VNSKGPQSLVVRHTELLNDKTSLNLLLQKKKRKKSNYILNIVNNQTPLYGYRPNPTSLSTSVF